MSLLDERSDVEELALTSGAAAVEEIDDGEAELGTVLQVAWGRVKHRIAEFQGVTYPAFFGMTTRSISIFLLSTLVSGAGPRVANETITMPASPPVSTLELENAFAGLSFSSPLCLRSPEGDSRRLFVCEKTGDLALIPDVTAANPVKTVFLDLDAILSSRGEALRTNSEMGLLSVAFHPDYTTNGSFFAVYNVTLSGVAYQRLSRWHDPNIADTVADPLSEEVLIEMRDDAGNHNGGDLHFGPDGYLYMSWGDEGNQNDSLNNSQFIDKDFWSSVMRIDVDLEPEDDTAADGTGSDDANVRPNGHAAVKLVGGNPLYEVPVENPWVGATSFNGVSVNPLDVRTEFYAVGFRNPWRFSFDSETGELWVGDVGQGAREDVDVVELGNNHGWAWYEGDANGPKFNNTINGASRTSAILTPPVWDYAHGSGEFQGNSITGGFVYRGTRIPELFGKYIFGDYSSGNIWSLKRNDDPGNPEVIRIAGDGGIAGFGPDPSNGDVLMADVNSGQIHRLVSRDVGTSFPATLTETGIFSDVASLTANPGVVPYEVNVSFWSDHAIKQRWFAIKNTIDQVEYSRDGSWSFPNGMVWVKHFDLELERGNQATKKRIETRVLVKNQREEVSTTVVVPSEAACKVLVPVNASLEATWMETGFDDFGWTSAVTGIGYDENTTYGSLFGAGGDLGNQMNGVNSSVYVRIPFQVSDVASVEKLTLRMKYDDGFVAYLNGQPVAEANPPSSTLAYNSGAGGDNPDGSAVNFEDFDLDAFSSILLEGENVLAIQGLNNGIGSSDMLILPELLTGSVSLIEGVYGVSYKWNEAGTEASLVGSGGENLDLMVDTGEELRLQRWNIPSRAACIVCHTPQAGHALSFNTRQLNREGTLGGMSGNFINLLHSSGYLDALPESPAAMPRHIGATEADYSLEARVRSYLAVNCAYCHQDPGTALPSAWKGNHRLTLDETGIINGLALAGTQNPNDRLIVPGDADRSVILNRVAATNGYTRMPALATNELDEVGIQLLTAWINQEASDLTNYAAWRFVNFASASSPEGAPEFDADGDGVSNHHEWLALSNPNDSTSFLRTSVELVEGNVEIEIPGRANRSFIVERSTNMVDWLRWSVTGNDGIPRNPTGSSTLSGTAGGEREFFRLKIEER
jgi:glucose/arabinose dehydrogenase